MNILFFLCVYFWNIKCIFTFRTANTNSTLTVKSRLHSIFVHECAEAIQKSKNLKRFRCTTPNDLAIFLPSLREKSRLEHMWISRAIKQECPPISRSWKVSAWSARRGMLLTYSSGGQEFYKRHWLISPSMWVSAVFVCLFIFLRFLTTQPSDDHWPQPKSPGISTCTFPKCGRCSYCWLSENRPHYSLESSSLTTTVSWLKDPSNSSLLSFQL